MMLRRNFRESSGVIVDVCSAHGVWFDRGELATIIEFAKTGAMAKAERDVVERAETRKRLDAWGDDLRGVGPRHYVSSPGGGGPMGPVDAIADLTWAVRRADSDDD
jgi:Zn-finger nucleic acid-binding protein